MKKLMFAAAVVAAGVALADVEGSGIVGYYSKTQTAMTGTKVTPTGIMSFQWEDVQGKTRKLNGTILCPENLAQYSYDESGTVFQEGWELNAPKIQVRKSDGGYATCYWCADAWNNTESVPMLGWADEFGNYQDIDITLGQGAWVSSPIADCTFQIAGAVAGQELDIGGDSSKATLLAGGGFPVAFKINDKDAVTWTVIGAYSYDEETGTEFQEGWHLNASKIQVRRLDGGYYTCYWCLDAWNENAGEAGEVMEGWADDSGNYQDVTVDVGGGFWMNTPVGDKKIFVKVKNPVK